MTVQRPVRPRRDGRRDRGIPAAQRRSSREDQDAFAAQSHQRAAKAAPTASSTTRSCRCPSRSAAASRCSSAPTRASARTPLPGRSPDSGRPSPPTARSPPGSASQISDGACAVVVTSAATAARRGLPVLAEIGAHGIVAGPDNSLLPQPSRAIPRALEREGLTVRRPGADRDQRGLCRSRAALDA